MTALETPEAMAKRLVDALDGESIRSAFADAIRERDRVIAAALEQEAVAVMSIPPRTEEDARIAFALAVKLLQFSREIGGAS